MFDYLKHVGTVIEHSALIMSYKDKLSLHKKEKYGLARED